MKKIFKKNQMMIVALALMIAVAGYLNFAGKNIEEETVASGEENTVLDENGVALLDISDEDIASLDSEYVEVSDQYTDVVMEMDEDLSAFVSETVDSADVEAQLAEETAGEDALAELSAEDSAETPELAENDVIDEVPGEAVFTSSGAINNLADARLLKEQTRARNKENLLEIINNETLNEAQKTDAINSMIALTDIAEREMSAEILLEAKGFDNAVVSITGSSADVCVAVSELSEVQCAQIIDIVQRKTGIVAENIVITPIQS
ncbi:MAG: SpoIIIAH-like family protein [Lachnospiraceae bacterium]|nr:SpoIIIAH-like family protein [Lachnospiraceae bacterium]